MLFVLSVVYFSERIRRWNDMQVPSWISCVENLHPVFLVLQATSYLSMLCKNNACIPTWTRMTPLARVCTTQSSRARNVDLSPLKLLLLLRFWLRPVSA